MRCSSFRRRRRPRMGEELGPDEPQHGWPMARGVHQPRADDARRLGSGARLLVRARVAPDAARPSPREQHRTRRACVLLRGNGVLHAHRARRRVSELLPPEARHVVGRRSGTDRQAGTARAAGTVGDAGIDGTVRRQPPLAVGPGEEPPQPRRDADGEVADHHPRPSLERDRRRALQVFGEQRHARRQRHEFWCAHVDGGEPPEADRPYPDVREHIDRLGQMRHRRPGDDHLGRHRHRRVDARADGTQRSLEGARLPDQPVVRVPARRVERHVQPLHAGGPQPLNHRRGDARARGTEPEMLGPQLHELVEQGQEVSAAKRLAPAEQESAGVAGDGARRTQDVARGHLPSRRPRSPRQLGRATNQRETEVDGPDRRSRDRAPPPFFARRRRTVETRVHVGDVRPRRGRLAHRSADLPGFF